jgi:hypothetical protein
MVRGGLLAFSMLFPLYIHMESARKMLETRVSDIDELLRRSVPMQTAPPIAGAYHRIQHATPAGTSILVLLDQPFHLDFARNEILNLDMPGTASPAPGIPCFLGPEPVAKYLLAKNIRYVAFVESRHSTHLYRRGIWLDHIWDPDEIWRTYAPYMLDVMDNLALLAKSRRHLHDEEGMILLDLEARQ